MSLLVLILCLAVNIISLYPQVNQRTNDIPYGKIIKEIRIEGLKRTKKHIVTRELISKVGEPLSKENLDKDYTRLERLDIFIDIQTETVVEEDGVILIYRFTETYLLLPLIGLQITDENGISVGGGLKFPNLFGKNLFFSGLLLFGGATTVELELENPWLFGNRFGYRMEYFRRERQNHIGDFYEKGDEIYLWAGSQLGKRGRIGGSLESLLINSDKDGITLSPTNTDKVTRIGIFLRYDSRNSFVDTRKGWWNEIAISREIRIFKNAPKFYQMDLDLRRYQPLPLWDKHSLALFSLLTLRTGEVGKEIATWQRFGMGGTNTVRGWKYASQIGKNQFINTLEYRITIFKPQVVKLPFNLRYRGGMHICFFTDLGIAWDKAEQFKARNFLAGFGVGVRLLLPVVGITRFDIGWGQKGEGIFLHLGSYEKPVMSRLRVR